MGSYLDKIGGRPALEAVVDTFYAKILLDMDLQPYFEGIEMKKLRRHQVDFISYLLGGTAYTGKSLSVAHTGLNITEEAFNKVGAHLQESLSQANVPNDIYKFSYGRKLYLVKVR